MKLLIVGGEVHCQKVKLTQCSSSQCVSASGRSLITKGIAKVFQGLTIRIRILLQLVFLLQRALGVFWYSVFLSIVINRI